MTRTASPTAKTVRRRWRVPLIMALALAFGSLALISAVAYFAVLAGATGTTERLLVDRANRVIEAQIAMVQSRLDPVASELELIAALIANGRIDVNSPIAIRETLATMLSQMPPVSIAAFGTLDLKFHRAIRRPNGTIVRDTVPLSSVPGTLERFHDMEKEHKTFWGDLFWSPSLREPVLNVRTPVRRADGVFIGALVATVDVGALSKLIDDPAQSGSGHNFILVGHDLVLAHRRLIDAKGLHLSPNAPLPTIDQVDDPVLAHIWDRNRRIPSIERALGSLGHIVSVDGRQWVFVQRELKGYGPEPWLVGQYFPIEEATSDLDRLTNGAIVGAGSLAFAALLALLLGMSMARSIRTITTAAEAIERLEFDQPLHKFSRLREIDDAGRSLEKARNALKWFGLYVPQRLVRRLMEHGEEVALASRRVPVTIMFTDIVAFTPQAESLPEQETAELLNHHFALLGACIEAEHGVIDKYIGDSVMAVWGVVVPGEDHAGEALRAALAIARVMKEDNDLRRADGKPPIRLRIGVHSGPAVVGNIGAPGRVNFTVIGDTVNVAQRFEQLGKEFLQPDEDVVVLTSGETLAAVKQPETLGIDPPPPQRWGLRGHEQAVDVYRLA